MWEKNLNQKLLLIGLVIVVGAVCLYPPSQKLRGGLDIAGGVSLIFEINDEGASEMDNLAEEMKRLLQKRVDPTGVYNLVWRVHGRNRLEVQMPLPPPSVKEKRRAYADALEALFQSNVTRGQMVAALSLGGEEREQALTKLAGGSAERLALLREAAEAFDVHAVALEAYRRGPEAPPTASASQPASAPATLIELEDDLNHAEEVLEDAYSSFMATNLNQDRFKEILGMDKNSDLRKNSLADFEKRFPDLTNKIEAAVEAYDAWSQTRGYLDGAADLQRLLRGAGVLEFRILAEPDASNPTKYNAYRTQLAERGPKSVEGDEFGWFKVDNPLNFFNLSSPAALADFDPQESSYVVAQYENDYYVLAHLGTEFGLLGGKNKTWQLRGASADRDSHGRRCVAFALDVVGGALFEELTRKHIGEPLCILVDDIAYSAPNIQTKIRERGQITGEFSLEKVSYLIQTMQAGSLPGRLKETPISERTIGSSLGATNRDTAFRAGVIGIITVAVFMAVYYMVSGLIANVALLLNIVLVLAIMAFLRANFTLAGIAGVILTIGMSVDANVLIFERMREEKERGSSLRLILKNGYEKAFSTIIDANITTLLTCVILYYVGSEEIKGFGLTLGWGIVISMFTALFVTRTIFALLVKYGLIKEVPMLKFIGVPRVDWYAKRKFFVPLSIIVVAGGLGLLAMRGTQDLLDVEFRGGVTAEIEVKPPAEGEEPLDDVKIAELLGQTGATIVADADRLAQAEVQPVSGAPGMYRVRMPAAGDRETAHEAALLEAMLTEPLEDQKWLQRGGVQRENDAGTITIRVQGDVDAGQLQEFIRGLPELVQAAGNNIADSSVSSVIEEGFGAQAGKYWSITTTARNRRLVQYALEDAVGDRLQAQERIEYIFRGDETGRPFPVLDRRLEDVIPGADLPATASAVSLAEFRDGVAMYLEELNPPQSVDPKVSGSLPDRLRNMRLQPGFQDQPWRVPKFVGLKRAEGQDENGGPLYSSIVILVADDDYRYSDDPDLWYTGLAQPELNLVTTALDTDQALRKVSQFKPQIAQRSKTQALLAMLLSWAMIIGYLWIRFGRPVYGIAGVLSP